jgi:two-component system response regulator AtoC
VSEMNERGTILIVEDEANMRKVLKALLSSQGYSVHEAANGVQALDALKKLPCEAVFCDIKMPVMDGMTFLSEAVSLYPKLPVIMITAFGSVSGAVAAIKRGAFDYITKPFEKTELISVVDKAISVFRSAGGRWIEAPDAPNTANLLGRSAATRRVVEHTLKVAPTPTTVLITGESGTGKNLVADLIHQRSQRHSMPYIKVNCAAIPANLFESELFGYEKGAFTGAVTAKAGRFELADKGTLFLDEIGEMSIEMQVKLLQVIQEGKFQRLGSLNVTEVDFRLVAATNQELEKQIASGQFREDLFYRLNVFPIHIPPLRERQEDVPHLTAHFLEKFSQKLQKEVTDIENSAMDALKNFGFPGNVRQLENIIERAILFSDGGIIRLENLPAEVSDLKKIKRGEIVIEEESEGLPLKEVVKKKTAQIEEKVISRALSLHHGNVTRTADYLKISRKALQLKMKEYGLRQKKGKFKEKEK